MKIQFAVAAAAALLCASPAGAADFYDRSRPAAGQTYVLTPTWSGFHVGAHLGYDAGGTFTEKPTFGLDPIEAPGLIAGVHAEFLRQWGSVVFGIGADWSYFNGQGSVTDTFSGFGFTNTDTYSERLRWMGSAYLKAGYDLGGAMIYVKGGPAFGALESKYSNTFSFFDPFFGSFNSTYDSIARSYGVGAKVGGGLAWMFAPNWSMDISYEYAWLNRLDFSDDFSLASSDTHHHLFKIGVARKLFN